MTKLSLAIAGAGVALGLAFSAGSASAKITTFANYSAIGPGANIMWKNNGANGTSGTGGSLYTISSSGSNTPGTAQVQFSFLQSSIAPYVTNVTADFTALFSTNVPALTSSGYKIQPVLTGSFSFLTTQAMTIGGHFFDVGSNLLSATSVTNGGIAGAQNSTSGGFSASTEGGSVLMFTSDFLDFSSTVNQDLALSFTSITQPLFSQTGKALRTFKALSTGSFSSDPAPIVTAVPEPASWALMIVGLGAMGGMLRLRTRKSTLATA